MKEDESFVDEDVAEFLNDLDIEEEIQAEEEVRKKNAKILLISVIGLVIIAGIFLAVNYSNTPSEEGSLGGPVGLTPDADSQKGTLSPQGELGKAGELDKKKANDSINNLESNVSHPVSAVKLPEKTNLKPSRTTPKKIEAKRKVPPKVASRKKPTKASKNQRAQAGKLTEYSIQLGAFVMKENAEKLFQSLNDNGFNPSFSTVKKRAQMYRVSSGGIVLKERAEKEIVNLKKAGINATYSKTSGNQYTLQIGSFYLRKNAENQKKIITELGLSSKITRSPSMVDFHKVSIGQFGTKKGAQLIRKKLEKKGYFQSIIIKES